MPRRISHHPGETLLEDCIKALDLSIAEAAAHLQIDERALEAICECRAPITADIAIRLEQAFGSTAQHWLQMQAAHDLARGQAASSAIYTSERGLSSGLMSKEIKPCR